MLDKKAPKKKITLKAPKKIIKKTIRIPKGSILLYLASNSEGNRPLIILEPSRGGMGIRLKMAKIKLIKQPSARTRERREKLPENRKRREKKRERIILLKGPAAPVRRIPFL